MNPFLNYAISIVYVHVKNYLTRYKIGNVRNVEFFLTLSLFSQGNRFYKYKFN